MDTTGRSESEAPRVEREGFGRRLYRALGPLAGGIILDTLDLATFGPFGLAVGWLVGFTVGWWIASLNDFGSWGRLGFALMSALYLTVPWTEVLPLATTVSALARYRGDRRAA